MLKTLGAGRSFEDSGKGLKLMSKISLSKTAKMVEIEVFKSN